MEQSGNLLLSIINNVLDMARIESGKVELDEDYVKDQQHICQRILQNFPGGSTAKRDSPLSMRIMMVKHQHVICDEHEEQEKFCSI